MGWQLFFIPLFFGHFRFSSYLCTINTGNGSCFERRSVSRYDGFQCSFWAAAVGYAIRFVFCSSTVAVLFLTLCLVDRTLANLQGVLLDGRHPFFMSGEFRISSNTLFPMTAVRSYRCRNIYQVSLHFKSILMYLKV